MHVKSKWIISFTLSPFIILLFALNSHAETSSSPVLAQKVASVDGGGGGSGGGSGSVMPDLFTGTMSYSIPLEVAPGRKGMQPNLALTYHSNNGNGWVGVGWDLEIGAIERRIINGLTYDDNIDTYVLRMAGSAIDLIYDSTAGFYRAKIEGSFYKIEKISGSNGPYWKITDKSGRWYRFGYTADTRQDDPGNPNHIFKWCLDHVEDTNGNYMNISYTKDQGQIYPGQIDYTGNPTNATGTTNYVKFSLESRTDAPPMFSTNFSVVTAKRLKAIDIWGGGYRVRAYSLSYAPYSTSTGRSLLTSMKLFDKNANVGPDGSVSGGTSLPAYQFGQTTPERSFANQTWTMNAPSWGGSGYTWAGDFTGDGRTDIATANGGTIYVKRSDGSSFGEEIWMTSANWGASSFTWAGDFNGDGKIDIASANGNTIWVKRSTGSSFIEENWTQSGQTLHWDPDGGYTRIGDFDGDGKMDIVTMIGNTIWVKRSMGSSFVEENWTPSGVTQHWGSPGYTWVGDFDGDGKSDIATAIGNTIYVKRSTGSSFVEEVWSTSAPSTWGASGYTWVGDFNGDGKMDIATAIGGTIYVMLSTGSSFTTQIWPTTSNWGDAGYTWVGDFNGDGMADIATMNSGAIYVKRSTGYSFVDEQWAPSSSDWGGSGYTWVADFAGIGKTGIATASGGTIWVKQPPAPPADLLQTAVNEIGGATTISYLPSTQYTNTQLPFPVQTVSSITTNDGNGVTATTNYAYSGGFFHIGERDFRGTLGSSLFRCIIISINELLRIFQGERLDPDPTLILL